MEVGEQEHVHEEAEKPPQVLTLGPWVPPIPLNIRACFDILQIKPLTGSQECHKRRKPGLEPVELTCTLVARMR